MTSGIPSPGATPTVTFAAHCGKATSNPPGSKSVVIYGADPVSTGVVEGGISEPWTRATIKLGKKVTDNNNYAFAA